MAERTILDIAGMRFDVTSLDETAVDIRLGKIMRSAIERGLIYLTCSADEMPCLGFATHDGQIILDEEDAKLIYQVMP